MARLIETNLSGIDIVAAGGLLNYRLILVSISGFTGTVPELRKGYRFCTMWSS